jgi:hypothetical protein
MTIINLQAARFALVGTDRVDGRVLVTPWAGYGKAYRLEGPEVVFPATISEAILADDPNPQVTVDPNPATFCLQFMVKYPGVEAFVRTVTVLHSDTPVDFGDTDYVIDVDPVTFQPSETGRAAWEAVAGQVTQAATQAAEAAEAAAVERAAAGTAAFNAGASAAAAQGSEEVAVAARSDAVAASTEAIQAQGAAELAKEAAEHAAASVSSTRIISHGWNATQSRGGSNGNVMWVGWVQPENLIEGADVWLKPTSTPAPDVPADDLLARFRADAITGVAVNSPVVAWPSTFGSHTLTGVGGPLLRSDASRKWVETDGVDDHLSDATLARTQPSSMVVVGRFVTMGTGRYLISGTSSNFHSIGTDASGDPNFTHYAGTALNALTLADTAWHVFIVSTNGASSELMVDGAVARAGAAGALNADGFRIAASPGLGTFSAVAVAEALVYDRLLTTAEKADITAKLTAYHGLS